MAPLRKIRLADAAKAFKDLPHQIAAFNSLDEQLTDEQRDQFAQLFRSDPPPKEPLDPAWLDPALALLRRWEGCRLKAYPDPVTGGTPWTIGWGFTRWQGRAVRQGLEITQSEADLELRRLALALFGPGLLALIPRAQMWPPHRVAALVSWAWNIGLGAAEGSTLVKRLAAGDDPDVVIREELPRWNKVGSKVSEGLSNRRAAEVELFTGTPQIKVAAQQKLTGPKKKPSLKPGDFHLVMNDASETLRAFDHTGHQLWSIPALARGQDKDTEWKRQGSDTPPGLYRVGQVYRDYDEAGANPAKTTNRMAYGWYSFDLIGLEGQEGGGSRWGRDGVMVHGGGTACGWPGAWAPRQALHPTLGCIRCHNIDLREKILPLATAPGEVYISVWQESP